MGCNAWNHSSSCNCGWGGDTGSGGSPTSSQVLPSAIFGRWGAYEAGRLDSYTIPNAPCPVCREPVFFYWNEFGSRVYFQRLGRPWEKHPCTDNGQTLGGGRQPPGKSETAIRLRGGELLKAENLSLSETKKREVSEVHIRTMRESGWHPLLKVKTTKVGSYQKIEGFDPIEKRRVSALTKADSSTPLSEDRPTFIRVAKPQAIECEVEQLSFSSSEAIEPITLEAWCGTKSIGDVQMIKDALAGSVAAMRKLARARSFDHESHNMMNLEKVDLHSADYWFQNAVSRGCTLSRLEGAYLRDILDLQVPTGTYLHLPLDMNAIVDSVAARLKLDEAISTSPSSMNANYYRNAARNIEKELRRLALNEGTPRLRTELKRYFDSMTLA